jgi:hypothetical protein
MSPGTQFMSMGPEIRFNSLITQAQPPGRLLTYWSLTDQLTCAVAL